MYAGLINVGGPLEGGAVALQDQDPPPRFPAAQRGVEAIEASADDEMVIGLHDITSLFS